MWESDIGWESEPGEWHSLITHPQSVIMIRQRKRVTTTMTRVEETETVAEIFPECECCGQRHPEGWYDPWEKKCRDPHSFPVYPATGTD
jgi:hypothetical protein